MKYFYNDKLIRTSKTHHYTHACIEVKEDGTIICQGCSSSKAGAEKVKNTVISEIERFIFSHKACIKALEEGKRGYYNKRHEFISFGQYRDFDIESEKTYLEGDQKNLERVQKWQIVEVEERA